MEIKKIFIEDQDRPMGLEVNKPVFSWELHSDERDVFQKNYKIQVFEEESGTPLWDTGIVCSGRSTGIAYDGEPLKPCTRYGISLTVQSCNGKSDERRSWFETGLMDPTLNAWEGAQWIAAPRFTVAAYTRGVFKIETEFRFGEGADRAGLVFGAGDYRLEDHALNELGLEGENYIRYEIDIRNALESKLVIYRVGYAPGDRADIPFAEIGIKEHLDWEQFHTLTVEVGGNQAKAYLDGKLIDAETDENGKLVGRQLNPRGSNDVLTYPRLNRIGFFADGKVSFRNCTVSNIRAPGAVYIDERPEGGMYGRASIFAESADNGLMQIEDGCFVLTGGQITADPSNTAIPMLRRTFSVGERLKRARVYITARGIYELQMNGRVISENLLAPGLSQYDKHIHYQTYDVTPYLQSGENGIGVTLASGWWSDAQTFTVSNYNYFGDREALLCKIVLEYEDGKRETIVSDTENWQYYGDGPYRYAGNFLGEQYDARLEEIYHSFSRPEFRAEGWEKPISYQPTLIPARDVGFAREWPQVNAQEPEIIGGYDAPVAIVAQRQAESRRKLRDGAYVYDFGQNMAGVPEIVFHEERGTKILIRYSEMLYPDLPKYAGKAGMLMRENYRDAESTDIYICRGDANGETYRPRFTFHGFRYMEVNGVSNAPELHEVKALQYSSLTDYQGSFICSEPLVNRFVENIKWSQLCNFISIPTDCPQRNERMGWTGDTHLFCNTALHNANFKQFYERNLLAIADLQEESGRYPEIAPLGGGFGGITYECASIFIAWELYLQYGDSRVLKRFYPNMKKFMNYLSEQGMPTVCPPDTIGPLTDWLAIEETDPALMWNAFYYKAADRMHRIADVLGEEADAEHFGKLRNKVKAFWNRHFVDAQTGKTCTADGNECDTQCSYAMALEYGLSECDEVMAEHLVRKVRDGGHRVGTGFFGTGLLCCALTDNGYAEDAYRMLLQTENPFWLYSVTQGATTIWECWDAYTKEEGFTGFNSRSSFNHYSFGSVLSWMYDEILGIQRMDEYPGFAKFRIRPRFDKFRYARGSVASPFGKIESGWEKYYGMVLYSCRIPVNTSAILELPDGTKKILGSGLHQIEFPWKHEYSMLT